MTLNNIVCLVLAGGYSSRMQEFKPLLPLGTGTVIEAVVNNARKSGVSDIRVVTGYGAAKLDRILNKLAVRQVHNSYYHNGMFSSILAGVSTFDADVEAMLLLPGDIPLVKRHTVRRLIRKFRTSSADIVYPVIGDKRGHPPLIGKNCFGGILGGSLAHGLRPVLAAYEKSAVELEVLDEGILIDMDTPDDYQAIVKRYNNRDIPSAAECYVLLAKLKVPARVISHSRKVADVAGKIAGQLNLSGRHCSVDIVTAAGLLHDIAKGKRNHELVGAGILNRLGYSRIAHAVALHTDFKYSDRCVLDEAAVLFLADKLVLQEQTVSLAERFATAMARYGADSQARKAIEYRWYCAKLIKRQVEAITELKIAALLEQGS